jgi:rare lipoprotein A (peptidoglycan hydrolase)
MRTNKVGVIGTVFLGIGLLTIGLAGGLAGRAKASPPPNQPWLNNQLSDSQPAREPVKKPLAVWQCISSWYGEDFDGLTTANGETYDMYGATAAHPTLPLGSIVRVVNPRNHHSAVVRINDRGPYVKGRELDVSYQVARQLGFDHSGTARVRVELLQLPSHSAVSHGD